MATRLTTDDFRIISTIRSDAALLSSMENTRINSFNHLILPLSINQFYMLRFHQDRMIASARAFGWDHGPLAGTRAFTGLVNMLRGHLLSKYNDMTYPAPLMLRIALSVDGKFTVTSHGPHQLPATIDQLPSDSRTDIASQLFPRSLYTVADPILGASYLRWRVFVTFGKVTPSLFTRCKTSKRGPYERALALLPASPANSILNGIQLQPEVLIVNESWEIMEGCRFTPYFWRDNQWITPALRCGGNDGTTRRWALEKGLCREGVIQGGSVRYNEIIVLSNGAKGFQTGIVRPWSSLLV